MDPITRNRLNKDRFFRQGRVWADDEQKAFDKVSEIGRVIAIRKTPLHSWYEYVVEVFRG